MTRPTLHLDFESRSTIDLTKCGLYVYAAHPTTDVICAAYAVEDEAPKIWIPRQPVILGDHVGEIGDYDVPAGLDYVIKENWTIIAHNSAFERIMWRDILTPRYGWPEPRLEQFRCTMTQSYAMSLPGKLEKALPAIGLDIRKDMRGHALMLQMCAPRKARKGEDKKAVHWFEDKARLERLYEYCKQDVECERELDKRLLALSDSETRLWHLDQVINGRGVHVDKELCEKALQVVGSAAAALDDEMRAITDGAVSRCTNVGELAKWLRELGFPTESLDKEHIDEMLVRTDLPAEVRCVLDLRRESAKAAVKKIDALLAGSNQDGRARGLLQFHAAGTGRWAGRRFQPQNIKRPELDEDDAIEAVSTGSAEYVRLLYGEPLSVVGDCLRGMVTASPGNRLIAADFSNIEGRVIAWLAGEDWKLDAFRAFDKGLGHDIYHITAGEILGKAPGKVTKEERQGYGKVPELALGFQGGVGAFQKMAHNYGVSISDQRADEIKVAWREKHPNVVKFWYDLERAAKDAITHRGQVYRCGRIAFRVAGSFMFMRLPSGRSIVYPYPCIKPKLCPWGEMRDQVCYQGTDTYTRKWGDCFAHGGLLFNNAVQGTARDIEAEAMLRVEAAGYPNVLNCHDEVVCEVPIGFGSVEEFEKLMTMLPTWAGGLPIAAAAWEGQRYRKG